MTEKQPSDRREAAIFFSYFEPPGFVDVIFKIVLARPEQITILGNGFNVQINSDSRSGRICPSGARVFYIFHGHGFGAGNPNVIWLSRH
jgi:hypothetical protein